MANVKNGALREIIIDQCLQSRRGYSTQEIFDKCNDALEGRGELPITALNTVRNDILSIQNRWHVVVEEVRNGREKRYRYKDPDFSIFKSSLNEDEIEQLSQSISLLRRFEGMPGFEWVEEMNAHIQTTVGACPVPVIGFDENKLLKGMSYFTPLFKSITSDKAIKISYKGYNSNKLIEEVVHPYYLKEYNQRWFLFALNDRYKRISNFALDRIESIGQTSVKYIPNTTIDFAHYFDNVVGVSVNDGDIQKIEILLYKKQAPYILSKPIHKSQKVIEEREDGSVIISIEVIPNYELTQLLLSFGDRIRILSPDSLVREFVEKIKRNCENYE